MNHAIKMGFVACLSILMLTASMNAYPTTEPTTSVSSPLDFRMRSIDGEEVDLSQFKGSVILIVNVASQCGLTPQYDALQKIYETYHDRGFVVLGFPANNFGAQEPGTDSEIKQFCKLNYGVTFPMFSKISVKGGDQHPLYAHLTGSDTNPSFAGEIRWNFTKFLLDRQGKIVARFEPKVKPDSPELVAALEKSLDTNTHHLEQ
jgi:glutathione peroxidase